MSLGRILSRPSGTVPAQPTCAARSRPSLARLGLGQRSAARAAHGLAQLGRRERWRGTRALWRQPHRRTGGGRGKHGGASPARGRRRDRARGRRRRRAGGTTVRRRPTRDDGGEGQRGRDNVRTRRRGVPTDTSDGVDGGGGGEDDDVARSDMCSWERTAAVGGARGGAVGGGAVGARHGDGAVGTPAATAR
jgi:hypothetical protein